MLDPKAQQVAEHYEANVIAYEKIRLEQDSPIEFAITKRILEKWIPNGATVLDVGVGVGHYDVHLAKRACQLHLVDISEQLLTLAQQHLEQYQLSHHILSCTQTSATDLSFLPDGSVDCVLMLGPFYHLVDQTQREQAVSEAYRVLKPDGLLFAAAINRLSIFQELFKTNRFFDDSVIDIKQLYPQLQHYCETGVSDKTIFPPLGDAYCATIDEFSALFSSQFHQVDYLGVESFAAFKQKLIFEKPPETQDIWLSLLETTARTPEGLGCAEHLLYVGRKATL